MHASQGSRRSVALALNILRRLFVSSELLGHRLQRRIKLHKAVFDRGMVVVTLPARLFGIQASRLVVVAEIKISPLFGEAALIFYFDAHAHEISLKVAGLIVG